MFQRLRLSHLFLTLFLLLSFTSAWPWPPSLKDLEVLVLKRQDNSNSNSSSSSPTGSFTPSKTASPASSPSGSAAATSSGAAPSSGAAKSGSSAAPTSTQQSSVDPRLPAGGVNLISPSSTSTTYYKIGMDKVTFAWNYTSLSVTPSAVDVIVSCQANSATYPISKNMSYASTGSVVWDNSPDQTGTAPLLTETYTLIIHDAAGAVTQVAAAGHLGSYNQFQFGMYVPKKPTAREEFVCATCSGALSDMDMRAIKFMLGMCAVTVVSFTWFVGGVGGML